jgi:tRNA/tmRNA/rRNA uracil-C5-methylase (TrmA/RlmC/RlmD family)
LNESQGHRLADLYAGVGLFTVGLAARGASVLAVEGDPSAVGDLKQNAGPYFDRIRVVEGTVESATMGTGHERPDTVVVDPPRTGMSADALTRVLALAPGRLLYVSCDPPTLARDAALIVARGYALERLTAFDLFPNTAHVESLATFVPRSP